ncbi:MAG: type II toxin-antitoxin system prevent-host-death family antitoxin [Deltaproteobacteria bacterium]|nr:type II toxin-antitoxin system prevent-host-death family antitoxin [Deltaproteobacteria bacterium]
MRPQYGHVYAVDLNPRFGTEPGKARPVVVVQTDALNRPHPSTIICPLATKILAELEEDKAPVLITEHGKPAAYLVDVGTFEALQNRIRILEGIARGEKAIQRGRVMTHTQAKRKLRRWLD